MRLRRYSGITLVLASSLGYSVTALDKTAPSDGTASAVLLDDDGPWRDAKWQLGVKQFRDLLRDAGYRVRTVSPARLTDDIAPAALIAAPSLERLPLTAFRAIAAHTARGGSLLASGGEPFREPLYQGPGGAWVTVREILLRARRTTIVEPAASRLNRAGNPPEGVVSQRTVAGPEGKQDSLEVAIAKPVRVDPFETEAFPGSPFTGGATTTIVTVRGTPEESLQVEWREDDGMRWRARVPLTREWRTHVLRPSDFTPPPSGSASTGVRAQFEPARARILSFGLASEVNTPITAPVEYAIGPIAVGTAPQIEDFAPPVLETISPWYKQYDAMRRGHAVRVPIGRPRGLTTATETEGRYDAIGNLLDPAATSYAAANGATSFWLPWPELSGAERSELVAALKRASRRLSLLNGGADAFVKLTGERLGLGARVLNASSEAVKAEVTWAIRLGNREIGERRTTIQIRPGETRDVAAEGLDGLGSGEYRIETAIAAAGTTCDRVNGYVRVLDARDRPPQQPLKVENGHFTAGGKRVFLNGVNYWPRNVSGLEQPRYWDHWLTPHNYDPDIVEADLAVLQKLGFNMVSIQYNRVEQGRPLMDFLERCRRHGIWAHLSIGSANNLSLRPERDTALVEAARLSGNRAVFAYELAWEPHFGAHAARTRLDSAWRTWVLEQFGSVSAAEKAWGMPAPTDANGNLTNPSDQQISNDGPHRIMVAAYRRFLDDLVSRAYGRAVRHIRSLDPDAMFAVRTGWGGTGQRGNNTSMGYDLLSGAAHLDAVSAEAYGMPATYAEARRTGFITAYARYAGNNKPVLWLEYGASVGPRDGTMRMRRNQTLLCETMMRVAADSGADGGAVWWFPGGWRVNERSDFGIFNPDGSARDSARAISEWGTKLNAGVEAGVGDPVVIDIDRDADARGMLGLWEKHGPQYVSAREAGRPARLTTQGFGTDTANMPMVQVGNVPYAGTGPLKYANAEIAGVRITWPGGVKTAENGDVVELPAEGDYDLTVFLMNTGESAWLPGADGSRPGACLLHTSAGDAAVEAKIERFGTTHAGPMRVKVGSKGVEVTGRMAASGPGAFGESLKLVLQPRNISRGDSK